MLHELIAKETRRYVLLVLETLIEGGEKKNSNSSTFRTGLDNKGECEGEGV